MKTAVSIPDDVFAEVERLVRERGVSRSQLYAEALREYVARHHADAVTEALNRVYSDEPDGVDEFVSAASQRLLRQAEW
ncbi:MAG: ribbon-helix-helix protein, CopG family [Chloroflexi bacterium]|nr:ribbon-helix-helix protein, CopG family [Chloroflexota bacterium]